MAELKIEDLTPGTGATAAAGLTPCAFDTVDLATFIGEVAGVDTVQLPAHLADFDCRNNQLPCWD